MADLTGRAPPRPVAAGTPACTGKERMLNAYRGRWSDCVAIAPEFWYYYPAKVLGVDMIRFQREVPFHLALKTTFEKFSCEGWGIAFPSIPNDRVTSRSRERWVSEDRLEVCRAIKTPHGELISRSLFDRHEPAWEIERPVKDLHRDLAAFEDANLPDPSGLDAREMVRAWEEVGESYLLEGWLGVPFFDFYACARQGGLEAAIIDFVENPELFQALQEKYIAHMTAKVGVLCEKTPFESFVIGCAWSCNSLIGPAMWRRWDKPVIAAVASEVHRHDRLLHVHFHGRCMETVADFAAIGIDCVCPFERPPGGDVDGLEGLKTVERVLRGRTAMNGNVHTVQTLIRGTPDDVRREVGEILEAFKGNPRVIVGTGDQVGRETPEENLHAMIDEAKRASRR